MLTFLVCFVCVLQGDMLLFLIALLKISVFISLGQLDRSTTKYSNWTVLKDIPVALWFWRGRYQCNESWRFQSFCCFEGRHVLVFYLGLFVVLEGKCCRCLGIPSLLRCCGFCCCYHSCVLVIERDNAVFLASVGIAMFWQTRPIQFFMDQLNCPTNLERKHLQHFPWSKQHDSISPAKQPNKGKRQHFPLQDHNNRIFGNWTSPFCSGSIQWPQKNRISSSLRKQQRQCAIRMSKQIDAKGVRASLDLKTATVCSASIWASMLPWGFTPKAMILACHVGVSPPTPKDTILSCHAGVSPPTPKDMLLSCHAGVSPLTPKDTFLSTVLPWK